MRKRHATDRYLITPLYSVAEAARVLTVPASTLRNWAVGYSIKRADGRQTVAFPLVTTAPRPTGSRAVVPFIGLAEAYTLLAFKAAGVPVQRIRPAIRWLEEHLGLMQALASERLTTDGAEVLYDFAAQTDDRDARDAVEGLVVVRSGQQVSARWSETTYRGFRTGMAGSVSSTFLAMAGSTSPSTRRSTVVDR